MRRVLPPVLALLALVVSGLPASAQGTDPCVERDRLSAAGDPAAKDFDRICAAVGAVSLTPECVGYWRAATETDPSIAPSATMLESLAGVCNQSMPGGASLAAPSGPCRDRECREPEPVLEPVTDPTPGSLPDVGPDDGPPLTCGDPGVECRPPDQMEEPEN